MSSLDTQTISVEVEPGIAVGGRLYPAQAEAPTILYFHGNGEIAADYDFIAPAYTTLGLTLLIVDYRGYGISDGLPIPGAGHNDLMLVGRERYFKAIEAFMQ